MESCVRARLAEAAVLSHAPLTRLPPGELATTRFDTVASTALPRAGGNGAAAEAAAAVLLPPTPDARSRAECSARKVELVPESWQPPTDGLALSLESTAILLDTRAMEDMPPPAVLPLADALRVVSMDCTKALTGASVEEAAEKSSANTAL